MEDLDNRRRNRFSGLAESAGVFLEIGLHILKHQIEDRFPLFVLPLLDINQPKIEKPRV